MNDTEHVQLMKLARQVKSGELDSRCLTREVWSRVKPLTDSLKDDKTQDPQFGKMRNQMRGSMVRSARRG